MGCGGREDLQSGFLLGSGEYGPRSTSDPKLDSVKSVMLRFKRSVVNASVGQCRTRQVCIYQVRITNTR
jgi:hypothetical protein